MSNGDVQCPRARIVLLPWEIFGNFNEKSSETSVIIGNFNSKASVANGANFNSKANNARDVELSLPNKSIHAEPANPTRKLFLAGPWLVNPIIGNCNGKSSQISVIIGNSYFNSKANNYLANDANLQEWPFGSGNNTLNKTP